MKARGIERGSMTIEVAFLLVLLVAPLFYLVATLGRVQAGAYAVSAAAREAGRAFVTAEDAVEGSARAQAAALLVMGAHGFTAAEGGVVVSCQVEPCLAPGGSVSVDASVRVPLPLIPDFMAGAVPTSIELTSRHVEPVEAFREGG